MIQLFNRVKDTILTDINDIFQDKETNKGPLGLMNQYIVDCEKEINKIEKLITRQENLSKEFTKEFEVAEQQIEKYSNQITTAKETNKVELIELGEKEVQYYQTQVEKITTIRENIKVEIKQLQKQVLHLQQKLQEMKMKKLEFISKENTATINKKIEETEKNPLLRFEEVEKKIKELEEKMSSESEHANFDSRIANLERELKESKHI